MKNNKYFHLFSKNKSPSKKEKDIISTQLFEDYYMPLLLTSYARGFSGEDARDVVSNFFLKDILPNKQYKHFFKIATSPDGNLEAYIYRSFKNHCLKELKKRKKRIELKEKTIQIECDALSSYNHIPDNSFILDKILSYLPERQRLAVYFWMHGFTAKEIANKIGVSAAVKNKAHAIRNTIYRAILHLKKRFRGNDDLYLLLCN